MKNNNKKLQHLCQQLPKEPEQTASTIIDLTYRTHLLPKAELLLTSDRQKNHLTPDDLVSAVYEALLAQKMPIENYKGFVNRVMRNTIIRHARDQDRHKRGGQAHHLNLDNFLEQDDVEAGA